MAEIYSLTNLLLPLLITATVYRDFSINPLGNYIESIFQKWKEYHLF